MNQTPAYNLLVVDDDPLVIEAIRILLPSSWRMTATREAPTLTGTLVYHGALVDMHLKANLKKAEGPAVIAHIHQQCPQAEIIGISGDLSMDLMEACLRSGASRFLPKPLQPAELLSRLEKIEALWQLRNRETRGSSLAAKWIGTSSASENLRRQVASLRGEPGPILLEGETGAGKDVLFRLLNEQEPNRPKITVNIASIPEALFESELFGHVKGAFTGADSAKMGLAEAASGGDLFLDEIEALPLSQQVKLLRFLESGEVRRVGGKESIRVQVRVIVASNQPLQELVQAQKFREDLLFRLSGKKISIPPLRQRVDDVSELAEQFLADQRPRLNKTWSPEALQTLRDYSWPGNVRELKRVCEQLALVAPLPIIRTSDVQKLLQSDTPKLANGEFEWSLGLSGLMDQFESEILRAALKTSRNEPEQALKLLQISRSSFYQKMKKHKLQESP